MAGLLPGLIVSTLLAGAWFGAGAITASRPARPQGATLSAGQGYVVRSGDTLWGIAARLDPTGDPRPLVDALAAQLHGGPLEPGEVLVLP